MSKAPRPRLSRAPGIDRLALAMVNGVPPSHPEYPSVRRFPVYGWVIRHPDGPIVVDTGIGFGHDRLDELYPHTGVRLTDALTSIGVDPRDVVAVALSHLHFDHCGQHAVLRAPVYVQNDELDAARQPRYTISEWAVTPEDRLRRVRGDAWLADGVRLLSTPGHTPGHQGVVVEWSGGRTVLAAQCAFRGDELRSGRPSPSNLHDPTSMAAAQDSLERIRALAPAVAHLSHDPLPVTLDRGSLEP
jgi:N-acyl homoserine lactone hydrolase